jgi:hypothetical protein
MSGLKAIETKYSGHLFRSRLEARWAVAFDSLHVRWEYEREGFDLGDGVKYLPDFWLPDLWCWFEVKGDEPTDEELEKARRLRDHGEWPVVLAVGPVSAGPHCCYANDIGHSSGGGSQWDVRWYICDGCKKAKLSWGDGCHTIVGPDWGMHPVQWCLQTTFVTKDADDCGPKWSLHDRSLDGPIRKAVDAAKSARFEHGESGARGGLGGIPRLWKPAISWPSDAPDPF